MKYEKNTSDSQDRQPKSFLIKKLGAFIRRPPVVAEAESITQQAAIVEAYDRGVTSTVSRLELSDTTYTMELTQLHTEGALPASDTVAPYSSQVRVSVLHSSGDVMILVAKNSSVPDERGYVASRYYNVELLPEGEVCVRAKAERDAMVAGSNLKSADARGQDIAVGPDSFIATLSEFRIGESYPNAEDNLDIQPHILLVKNALAAVESYESQ